MDREKPCLYVEKRDCCGCGACLNICPKQAISMVEDEYGYRYPHIDEAVCVGCGMCKQVCSFQKEHDLHNPLYTYAAVAKNKQLIEKSSSGGVFASIASCFLKEQGIVYGAVLNSNYQLQHQKVEDIKDLGLLQGSKYLQSDLGRCYKEVKELLENDTKVLFSGTPCQIDGLYGYLGRDYANLLTVDIVCHGVPSNKMFIDYVQTLGETVTGFTFRDKSLGWGKNGSAIVSGKKVKLWESQSAYLYYFSRGWINRSNCYVCKYASLHRPADITLGDYWGIEKQHPDYLRQGWDEKRGISLVIVNTDKGKKCIDKCKFAIDFKISKSELAVVGNSQLREPSKPGRRKEILGEYLSGGWTGVEKSYKKKMKWRRYSSQVKSLIPMKIKRFLKAKRQ